MILLGDKVNVFGINVYTDYIIDTFEVISIIDDFASLNSYRGKPIIRSSQVNNDIPVINCAGGKINTSQKLLKRYTQQVIHYAELQKVFPDVLRELVFNEDFSKVYSENRARFSNVYDGLCDAESKFIFEKIVSFRETQNVEYLKHFRDLQEIQYFEPFLKKSSSAVFYDVGCFDGKTTEDFIQWNGNFSNVIYFEPFIENFKICKNKFSQNENVIGVNAAVSNMTGSARLSGGEDTATIDQNGDMNVELLKLDELVPDKFLPPTFVKIDIEGGEMDALKGMKNIIKKYSPQIAVSVYHKPTDFVDIPEFILSQNKSYKIYLRHYTESIYETVMFFIPET